MKIICTMPARNEEPFLGFTARAILEWCDELVILDHASTDHTPRIITDIRGEFPGRVQAFRSVDQQWSEMAHRQALLDVARLRKATHIVTVDADEVLTGNLLASIHGIVAAMPARGLLQLPWVNLRGSLAYCHASGTWGEAFVSTAFQDSPECHWTNATRGGYDFHHRHPMGRPVEAYKPVPQGFGGLFHMQMVDDRRLRAKQALYKMTEVLRWPGREPVEVVDKRYNPAVYGQRDKPTSAIVHHLKPVPESAWSPYTRLLNSYLDIKAAPWQEAEARRLWTEHGAERFSGLDLFGVCEC